MTAFDPTAHKLLTAGTGSDKPQFAVPSQRVLANLLSSLGFDSIEINTIAPTNVRALWYNKDTDQFRRYNPLTASWSTLVPTQWFFHILQLAFRAAGVEGIADNADKLPFFDVSADETKMITIADLKASLGVTGWVQYGATQTLAAPVEYVEFDLPTAYSDFLMVASYNTQDGDGTTRFRPRMKGVYPTAALTDLSYEISGTFNQGTARTERWWYSGDRSDLTGSMLRMYPPGSGSQYILNMQHLTNRVAKIRFGRPDGGTDPTGDPIANDYYRFTVGSVFKVFVR
jgi:hypothetical protein